MAFYKYTTTYRVLIYRPTALGMFCVYIVSHNKYTVSVYISGKDSSMTISVGHMVISV